MLATGILVVRGWQLCGPSAEQMKSFTGRTIEWAHEAWNGPMHPAAGRGGSLAADPLEVAPPFGTITQPPISTPATGAASANTGIDQGLDTPAAPPVFAPSTPDGPTAGMRIPGTTASEPGIVASDAMADADSDRLPALLFRLEELGGVEPQLVPWGSSGRLYRFCCRAVLADSPSFSRHFESVASEPLVAVEQVVAKVEAWRAARPDEGPLQ